MIIVDEELHVYVIICSVYLPVQSECVENICLWGESPLFIMCVICLFLYRWKEQGDVDSIEFQERVQRKKINQNRK